MKGCGVQLARQRHVHIPNTLCHQQSSMPVYDHSFLPTEGRQPRQKLERYAQLYTRHSNLIQTQADRMRRDTAQAQYAYQQVTAEFGREQSAAANKTGTSYVLADLNEYERRCNTIPKSFEEYGVRFL